MITCSIEDLRLFKACCLEERVIELEKHFDRLPPEDEQIPLSVWWELPSTLTRDKWWSLRVAQTAGAKIAVVAAYRAARRALTLAPSAFGNEAVKLVETYLRDEPVSTKMLREAASDASKFASLYDADNKIAHAARAANHVAGSVIAIINGELTQANDFACYVAFNSTDCATTSAGKCGTYKNHTPASAVNDERLRQDQDLNELISAMI